MQYSLLEGKTVLITGSAMRIGRSLALSAAKNGADIIIHYGKSRIEAEKTRDEIQSLGRKAYLLSADLNDFAQVEQLIPSAIQIAPLFAIVNSASIFESITWEKTTLSDWNRHLNINLTAPFFLSQAFAKTIEPSGSGRIINLLDWRALRPGVDHFPYTISKAALSALTKSLAQALAPRITVNAIALGAILPPSDGNQNSSILDHVPASRWGEIDEINQVFTFLLTGPAYITGEIIHVDGGRHLV